MVCSTRSKFTKQNMHKPPPINSDGAKPAVVIWQKELIKISLSQYKFMQKFWQNFLTAFVLFFVLTRNDIKTWGLNPSACLANLSGMLTYSFLIQIKCGLNRPSTVLCSHHLPAKGSKCFSHSQQRPSYQHAFRILCVRTNSTLLLFWLNFRKSCTQIEIFRYLPRMPFHFHGSWASLARPVKCVGLAAIHSQNMWSLSDTLFETLPKHTWEISYLTNYFWRISFLL